MNAPATPGGVGANTTATDVDGYVSDNTIDGATSDLSQDQRHDDFASGAGRCARVTWADLIEPEPVTWAWEPGNSGRIAAGSLSVAAGREGTGKSSFGIWLAAQITRGSLPGAFQGTPRSVLYVAVEDSWKHTLVPRFMAANADLTRIGRLDMTDDVGDDLVLSLPSDNSALEKVIRYHEVALVVIDPLMSVIGDRIDTHRERDVRRALDPLARIADRTGALLLGIAHFAKGSGTDAASLITGSGAFKNVPRSIFGFARDEADEESGRVMTQVKNSLGRDDLPSLKYHIESAQVPTKRGPATTGRFVMSGVADRSVSDVLRDPFGIDNDPEERNVAVNWLVGFLTDQGGEAAASVVYTAGKEAGHSKDALKRAKPQALARSAKSGMTGGWVWKLDLDATKGAKSARQMDPPVPSPPSLPSMAPDARRVPECSTCGEPLDGASVLTDSPVCSSCELAAITGNTRGGAP